MSPWKMFPVRSMTATLLLGMTVSAANPWLQAKDLPADVCSLLPAAQIGKLAEQPFGSPDRTTAPAAFPGSPTGTDCTYHSTSGPERKLLFRTYVESSAAIAKETFHRLSKYYGPNTNVNGNWDEGYIDARHGIHVLKGNVRYYLGLTPTGSDSAKVDRQVKALANSVAGQF
jgi:hypothetical protein